MILPLLLAAPPRVTPPKLLLVISVDQLSAESLVRLAPLLGRNGIAGLERRGVGLEGRYLTANTETGPGHATLATGAYADEHGVVGNLIMTPTGLDYAVRDSAALIWGSADPKQGLSPRVLRVPTVGDQLKLASGGRSKVVSVTGKDRSAVLMGGFASDLTLWWDPPQARFVSSAFYGNEPVWLTTFNKTHPAIPKEGYTWDTALPRARYTCCTDPDDRAGEGLRHGLPATMPKRVAGDHAHPGKVVRYTPRLDELTLQLARQAVEQMDLGKHGTPDLLWLGMSAHDLVGHAYGPRSLERADTLLRASNGLDAFVTWLERRVGKGNLAVVLAADHGATPLPETTSALRAPSGRQSMEKISALVDSQLDAQVGPNDWVLGMSPPNIWLRKGKQTPTCPQLQTVADVVAQQPGVWRAVASCRLAVLAAPVWRPLQHAQDPVRGGDILVELAPWNIWEDPSVTLGTDHATSALHDQRVPIVLMLPGWKVRADASGNAVDMRRVAPTLSAVLGIEPPPAGRLESLVEQARR